MKAKTHITCLCCKEKCKADLRNAGRQKYCSKPTCRKASKAASQCQWNQKPENQDFFQRAENTKRVREWRAANPGYWRRASRSEAVENVALQETLIAQSIEPVLVTRPLQDTLQDTLVAESPLFVGLVSFLSGMAEQEHITELICKLASRGQDILCMSPGPSRPTDHEEERNAVSKALTACARHQQRA